MTDNCKYPEPCVRCIATDIAQEWQDINEFVRNDDIDGLCELFKREHDCEITPADNTVHTAVEAYIDEVCLEQYAMGKYSLANNLWDITEVGVLIGYGGPTIRLHTDGEHRSYIRVSWGSDSYDCDFHAPDIMEHIYTRIESYIDEVGR